MRCIGCLALAIISSGCGSRADYASDGGAEPDAGPACTTTRIAMPPPDRCAPDEAVSRFGPMRRPLRLPGGERAFVALETETACTIELVSSPSLESIATVVLAESPCEMTVRADDIDGDRLDEVLVVIRDQGDPGGGPHRLRAAALDSASLTPRWESAPFDTDVHPSADFSTAPNDDLSWELDADGDCRSDLLESRFLDPGGGRPAERYVWLATDLSRRVALPSAEGAPVRWRRLARAEPFAADAGMELFGTRERDGAYELFTVNVVTGLERRWVSPASPTPLFAVATDLDGDGLSDFIVADASRLFGLRGHDLSVAWESVGARETRFSARVGALAADLDDEAGLEIPSVSGWIDARTGEPREELCVPGSGALGHDLLERPFAIDGRPALLEQEPDRSGPWPLRAHDLSTGALLWEHSMPPSYGPYVFPADFDDDGSVDVLVPLGSRRDERWREETVAYVDGAAGTMTVLNVDEWTDYTTTFELYDVDDDGAPELTLHAPATRDRAHTCFFPAPHAPPLACQTVGRLVGR